MKILEQIYMPQESVNDEDVVIVKLYFASGDAVKNGDEVLEIESSKRSMTLMSHTDGFVRYHCAEGDRVQIGSLVSEIMDESHTSRTIESVAQSSHEPKNATQTFFSKNAKRLMERKGLSEIEFQGKDFVNEQDVQFFLNANQDKSPQQENDSFTASLKKQVRIEKLSAQKRREIEYLSSVQAHGLNSSLSISINAAPVIHFSHTFLSLFKGSLLPIVMYEVARLLKKYPKLNAFYNNGSIIYYEQINIGLAVDLEDHGLQVLGIEQTDRLSMVKIEEEVLSQIQLYTKNSVKTSNADITFTITDLSNENITTFSPLINKDNGAILGISALDHFRHMNLSLTFDHRITEGKYVARFMAELKKRIENGGNGIGKIKK